MAGAGDLRYRVAIEARIPSSDGYGNERSADWTEKFQRPAAFMYVGGGEAVQAARLEGRSLVKVRLRSDPDTRAIIQDWRLRDVRRGTVYAIREADTATDRRWVYLTVEAGVVA